MNNSAYLLAKLPVYWLFRTVGRPTLLPFNYTFSVTYRCNSRCKTCNIWNIQKKVKVDDELKTDEWIKIIKSLGGAPFWITISGGEPSLRRDLVEIIEAIVEYNNPAIINLPLNGLLTNTSDKIVKILEILKNFKTKLVINYSIDGIGKEHDEIRGIKDNWEKVIDNYWRTKELKKEFPNLVVGIHTVISRWNVTRLSEITKYLIEKLKPDQYITEIAEERVEMENFDDKPTPKQKDYEKAINFLVEEIERSMENGKWKGLAMITEAFRLEYYKYVRDLYLGRNSGMKSYAGFAACQISPTGDVWECAVYATKMGNLRDFDCDFKKLWNSEEAWKVRKKVKEEHKCPLANEAYVNMLLNPQAMIQIGINFIRGLL